MIYSFGGYELDLDKYELRGRGSIVPVEPQVFDVLAYLIQCRDRVVSKEELLDNVWGDRFVSESALTSRIKAARRAIGDDGSRQTLIRTTHGRGYRFVGSLSAAGGSVEGEGPTIDARRTGLAGRERELTDLQQLLARAAAGDRQLVFVAGSPGIGKTALVQELVRSLPSGTLVGVGQCIELRGAGEAYLPVLGAIRHACGGAKGRALVDRLVDVAPSWVLQLPGLVPLEDSDSLRARAVGAAGDRMLRELLDAVCFTSDGSPLVLVVEDLHWSDESTLDLIDALAADQRAAPLLFVGTHRPSDGSSTSRVIHALAVNLRLRQRASLVTLDALSVADVADLTARRLGGEVDADLLALIHERTGGVPLFIEHLLDDWLSAGWLEVWSGRVRATRPLTELADAIPDGIRLLIEHTADRLAPSEQTILAAAAVAGRSFTSGEVAAATNQPEEDVEAELAGLARRAVFIKSQGEITWPDGSATSSFNFVHDLFRDVLYRRTGPARISAQHLRIGLRLEDANCTNPSSCAANLAVHFTEGSDFNRAVKYRIMAAEDQLQRSAHKEAIEHLHQAAALLFRLSDAAEHLEEALRVQVLLGNALLTAKGYAAPETVEAYQAARELCERLGGGAHLLPVLYGLWNTSLVGGQPRAALEVAEAFLALAERHQGPAVAVAHRAVAWPLVFLGDPAGALAHLEQVPPAFDEATTAELIAAFGEDPAATGWSLLAWVRWFVGDDNGATAAIDTSLARLDALGHPLTETYVHTLAAILAQMREDPSAALHHATRAVEIATRHAIPAFAAFASIPLAWATGRLGLGDGVELQRAGLAGMARTGTVAMVTAAKATLAELLAAAEDIDGALKVVEEGLELVRRTEECYYESELHRLRAELLAKSGQHGDAVDAASTATSVAEARGFVPFAARACGLLAELQSESSRPSQSRPSEERG
jgi:predicted ATPase